MPQGKQMNTYQNSESTTAHAQPKSFYTTVLLFFRLRAFPLLRSLRTGPPVRRRVLLVPDDLDFRRSADGLRMVREVCFGPRFFREEDPRRRRLGDVLHLHWIFLDPGAEDVVDVVPRGARLQRPWTGMRSGDGMSGVQER